MTLIQTMHQIDFPRHLKDSVNIHLKSIQVNFDFVKNAIHHLGLNEICRYLTGQSSQQNCFFRCVYLGKGSGSIFPTITTKCLTELAVFVIVHVLTMFKEMHCSG